MNANELMIGDWVLLTDGPARVISIAQDGIYFEDKIGEGICSFDKIQPIPLTAEILEKNGFRKCEGNEWSFYKKEEKGLYNILWSADELYLEIASYTSLTGEFNRMGIKYIHELQHALRLCGIEKEIEL